MICPRASRIQEAAKGNGSGRLRPCQGLSLTCRNGCNSEHFGRGLELTLCTILRRDHQTLRVNTLEGSGDYHTCTFPVIPPADATRYTFVASNMAGWNQIEPVEVIWMTAPMGARPSRWATVKLPGAPGARLIWP